MHNIGASFPDEGLHTEPDRQLAAIVQIDERFENLLIDALGWFVGSDVFLPKHLPDTAHVSGKAAVAKRLAAEMRNGVAWAQRRGEPPLDLCHDEIERIGPERVVDELIVVEGERENADVARLTLACGERKLQMVEKPAAAADVGRWSSALDVWPAG